MQERGATDELRENEIEQKRIKKNNKRSWAKAAKKGYSLCEQRHARIRLMWIQPHSMPHPAGGTTSTRR